MPDIAAFGGILADSRLGKREVAVIADKGSEGDANEEALNDASLGYVMAVRRGGAGGAGGAWQKRNACG